MTRLSPSADLMPPSLPCEGGTAEAPDRTADTILGTQASPQATLLDPVAKSPGARSGFIDRAYDQYLDLRESGQAPDIDEYCRRFPDFADSLYKLLSAHFFLDENPEFVAASQELRWPVVGDHFLGFNLLRELGRGTFARVFLAEEPSLGNRRVVVKISFDGSSEAKTLGRLNHPYVVPVHSVQVDALSGFSLVCMPYIGEATLEDVIGHVFAGQRLPQWARSITDAIAARAAIVSAFGDDSLAPAEPLTGKYLDAVVRLGIQLADGLAFVHGQGICHHDLKPSNVLLTPAATPMLIDFNLATDQRVQNRNIGGTIPYMSPEHLLALDLERGVNAKLLTAQSDLFSLGVILYELLTGKLPFGHLPQLPFRELQAELLRRHRAGATPLSRHNPAVDPAIARLVESCLGYNPQVRARSAAELATSLRRTLTPMGRVQRWSRRHWIALGGLGVATAAAAGLAIATFSSPAASAEIRPIQRARGALDSGDYETAMEHLNRALILNPQSTEALTARGLVSYRLGADQFQQSAQLPVGHDLELAKRQYSVSFRRAVEDFLAVDPSLREGPTAARVAYAYSCSSYYDLAIDASLKAIRAGEDSASVRNNLAYSYLMTRQLGDAAHSASLALQKDPALPAACRNLVRAYLARMLAANRPLSSTELTEVVSRAQNGLAAVPESPDLYFELSRLCAAAARYDSGWSDKALDHLKNALQRGLQRDRASNEHLFSILRNDPRFVEALAGPQSDHRGPHVAALIDPLPESRP